jgi:catechol 2,3-dioxygenase-like lactoylglutathione lyase family enzyme
MIDHISLRCRSLEVAKAFYGEALRPLGYGPIKTYPEAVGYGANGKPDFWITEGEVGAPAHVAFACSSRKMVDAFYEAALRAGGTDNGQPGPRPIYHRSYYGAFVLDPSGHNIEAVCHLAARGRSRAKPGTKRKPAGKTGRRKRR